MNDEMKCPECGAPVDQNAKTCPKCGCPLPAKTEQPKYAAPAAQPVASAKPNAKTSKAAIAGLIIGILVTLMGFNLIGRTAATTPHMASSYDASSASFGGDFYTYIYDASDTIVDELNDIDSGIESMSNSVTELIRVVYLCSGEIVMALGLTMFVSSLGKLKKSI